MEHEITINNTVLIVTTGKECTVEVRFKNEHQHEYNELIEYTAAKLWKWILGTSKKSDKDGSILKTQAIATRMNDEAGNAILAETRQLALFLLEFRGAIVQNPRKIWIHPQYSLRPWLKDAQFNMPEQ